MKKIFEHIPCGEAIPRNNPHAISVSLPTMSDVIGYEENNPVIKNSMQSGYPRFFMNKNVEKVKNHVQTHLNISDLFDLIPVSSSQAISIIESYIANPLTQIESDNFQFIQIEKKSNILPQIKSFIQHTGYIPSSRKAEDFLQKNKIIFNEFSEEKESEKIAESIIKTVLANAYENVNTEDIFLCNSGMTAIFSVFDSLKKKQEKNNRKIIVQIGWLYLDTMEIIKKYSDTNYLYLNILNIAELEKWLNLNHSDVAAIFTEVPNNPLVQCLDLPALHTITKKLNIPLVVDATIGTPFNIEVMAYSDIVVESLTKFACGQGDVLMGAVLLNKNSEIAMHCKEHIPYTDEKPYIKDLQRLAFSIKNYKTRVERIAQNTLGFIDYLSTSKKISQIYSAISPQNKANFDKIKKNINSLPGLISIVFDKNLSHYYDKLPLPKGPSLGTEFTLAMPYVYLAHYDLLKTIEGRKHLENIGVNPELLRISVGMEPVDELISIFEEILV